MERLINTPEEAIETIKRNWPTSNYSMLIEALEMAINALGGGRLCRRWLCDNWGGY